MTLFVFLLVLSSAVLHALMNFTARRVAGNLSAIWLGISLGAVLCSPFAARPLWSGPPVRPFFLLIAASGALQSLYLLILARAYAQGEVSLVYPIVRGTGITVIALASRFWLGEAASSSGIAGIAAICAGIFLLGFKKSRRGEEAQAMVLALLLGLIMAGYSLIDKKAMGGVLPVVYVCSNFAVVSALLAPYVWLRRRKELAGAWRAHKGAVLVMAACASGTYASILTAIRLGPLGYISATREIAVVIASILGIVILKETLTFRKGLGISAITLGLVLIKLA